MRDPQRADHELQEIWRQNAPPDAHNRGRRCTRLHGDGRPTDTADGYPLGGGGGGEGGLFRPSGAAA